MQCLTSVKIDLERPTKATENNVQQPVARVSLFLLQMATRTEYDKVIQETEGAYHKILESSQTLLTVLKRESVSIQKKRQTSS